MTTPGRDAALAFAVVGAIPLRSLVDPCARTPTPPNNYRSPHHQTVPVRHTQKQRGKRTRVRLCPCGKDKECREVVGVGEEVTVQRLQTQGPWE